MIQHPNVATTLPLSRPTSNRFVHTNSSRGLRLSVVSCSTSSPGDLQTRLETGPGSEEPSALKKRPVLSRAARVYAVKDEELVVDKVLTGRVKSIMTFGAFVDLGARIDGLLHVSKLGAGYVRNVEDVVKVGEEVKVQIMEVDIPNRRVKLQRYVPGGPPAGTVAVNSRMNAGLGTAPRTNRTSAPTRNTGESTATTGVATYRRSPAMDRPAASTRTATEPALKTENKEVSPGKSTASTQATTKGEQTPSTGFRTAASKGPAGAPGARLSPKVQQGGRTKTSYQKGQVVVGVVKNLTRKGCFVQLPGNEEGFLHANEVNESMEPIPIERLVKVGEELKVRVLRIIEGRLNLTTKEELEVSKVNETANRNVLATNAFELAFRENPIIRSYLEKTGSLKKESAED